MKQETIDFIREQWIPALRSGKFTQGKGALNKSNTFCCLGVICELNPRTTAQPIGQLGRVAYQHETDPDTIDTSFLPFGLAKELGIFTSGQFHPPIQYVLSDGAPADTLAKLNDEGGWTFPQIAGFLEDLLNPDSIYNFVENNYD